jgi:arabinose-5-phosphate isomerase
MTHMSSHAVSLPGPLTPFEQLRYAREIIELESHALAAIADRLDMDFCHAVDALYFCSGSAIVTGIGKAGLIGQKLAATLASTGTRSHFLHPAEAIHGDLGRIHRDDVVVVLSQSGETEEVVRLLPSLNELGASIIAITARRRSTLGAAASVVIELGPLKEACSLGLAPSTSTTAMLAVGDALALVTSRMRSFGREDFARFHPGGSLGLQLAKVEHHMRPLGECRIALCSQTVREVLVGSASRGRRTGAVMVVDPHHVLRGIFTDSDLARLFESHHDEKLDTSIRFVMTKRPATVPLGSMMSDAVEMMAERKISELPVVDETGQPQGMLDITDIVSLFPQTDFAAKSSQPQTLPIPRPKNTAFFRIDRTSVDERA